MKMKGIKYLKFAVMALVIGMTATSCMDDDWKAPSTSVAPYGNNDLQETNVVSIKALKEQLYARALTNQHDTTRITDNIQIKGRVVSSDAWGNISQEIAVDDGTGAILVCVASRGLYMMTPVGQEVLIDLKDLYIGTYGYNPQIGMPYTSTSKAGVVRTTPSRMSLNLWNQHFRCIGQPDASLVKAEDFDLSKLSNTSYIAQCTGKLMTFKGVKFAGADGKLQYATYAEGKDNGNGVSRSLVVGGKTTNSLIVRTSMYAKFATTPLPTGTVNLTGVVTRYGSTVQILLRDLSDVEEVK